MKRQALRATLAVACFAAGLMDPAYARDITARQMADALHAVVAADRAVYTKLVVNRLHDEDVLEVSEDWKEDKALPLPAQMFRAGAEEVAKTNESFSYSLISLWPINKKNGPKTPLEKQGLQFVADNPGKNFYREEKIENKTWFTAIYADTATTSSCVDCHNGHSGSPRRDFKLGQAVGGVVVRIRVE